MTIESIELIEFISYPFLDRELAQPLGKAEKFNYEKFNIIMKGQSK